MEEVWRRLELNDEEDCPIEIREEVRGTTKLKGDISIVERVILERRIGRKSFDR